MCPEKQEKCYKCDFFINPGREQSYEGITLCDKCYSRINNGIMAVHVHDCEKCQFVYTTKVMGGRPPKEYLVDVWHCPNTEGGGSIIVRFSNQDSYYWSSPLDILKDVIKRREQNPVTDESAGSQAAIAAYKYLVEAGKLD